MKAFTAKMNGYARELRTTVKVRAHSDSQDGSGLKEVEAIWDTGATSSVITESEAKELGLVPVNYTTMSTPNGERVVPCYYVDILLPNNAGFQKVLILEALPCNCGMLIGMDLIANGDFAISNYNGKTTFTFRCPSLMEFDFVQHTYLEPEVKTGQSPGRNSQCPCGSGKKFKQCHGKV